MGASHAQSGQEPSAGGVIFLFVGESKNRVRFHEIGKARRQGSTGREAKGGNSVPIGFASSGGWCGNSQERKIFFGLSIFDVAVAFKYVQDWSPTHSFVLVRCQC